MPPKTRSQTHRNSSIFILPVEVRHMIYKLLVCRVNNLDQCPDYRLTFSFDQSSAKFKRPGMRRGRRGGSSYSTNGHGPVCDGRPTVHILAPVVRHIHERKNPRAVYEWTPSASPITQVCRQIRQEALSEYWMWNDFEVTMYSSIGGKKMPSCNGCDPPRPLYNNDIGWHHLDESQQRKCRVVFHLAEKKKSLHVICDDMRTNTWLRFQAFVQDWMSERDREKLEGADLKEFADQLQRNDLWRTAIRLEVNPAHSLGTTYRQENEDFQVREKVFRIDGTDMSVRCCNLRERMNHFENVDLNSVTKYRNFGPTSFWDKK